MSQLSTHNKTLILIYLVQAYRFLFFIFLLNVCNYMRSLSNFIFLHVAVHERLLWSNDDFVWPIDSTFYGRFIIDVEFLDLKLCSLNVTC